MRYSSVQEGIFIRRPNRFIAHVITEGKEEICHVKNTGRCKELLIPGVKVYLEKSSNPNRKTKFDVIGVEKGNLLINMDSQVPNKAAGEWLAKGNLFSGSALIRPETKYGNSRFDFYVEDRGRKAFLEVKGVTLEDEKTAKFPDAPTLRGVKHVLELGECVQAGFEAYLLFVIQMKGVRKMMPNWDTHPEFGEALIQARDQGVHILAYDCLVEADRIEIMDAVPVSLERPE